jgi:hypothetical protein
LNSHLTESFIACFNGLPKRIQRSARRNYKLWQRNANHPSLQFKRVGRRYEAYSVRVGIGWRALGVKQEDAIVWFWIGSHAEYTQRLKQL